MVPDGFGGEITDIPGRSSGEITDIPGGSGSTPQTDRTPRSPGFICSFSAGGFGRLRPGSQQLGWARSSAPMWISTSESPGAVGGVAGSDSTREESTWMSEATTAASRPYSST